ncbi:MAG: hypothetical protein ACE5IZ_01425 [Dehalococcoidia bacterium]
MPHSCLLLSALIAALSLAVGCSSASAPTAPSASTPLLQALSKFPASFKEDGIWFGDLGRAVALAGWERPLSFEEILDLLALDRNQYDAYVEAMSGIVLDSATTEMSRAYLQQWRDAFGFDGFQITLSLTTGEHATEPPSGPAYLEGSFDQDVIRQRLLDLGYSDQVAAGRTYYAIRGDYEQDFQSPQRPLTFGRMNRVFVADGILVRAGATSEVAAILEAWAGLTPSLADDPALASLATALGDPLSAALLTRSTVLEPKKKSRPPPRYQKQPSWGTLHPWDILGLGYKTAEGSRWWAIALFYPDPTAAKSDGDELVRRMQEYTTTIQDPDWPQRPFVEFCGPLSWSYASRHDGSTLTVLCPLKEDAPVGMWTVLIDLRDLGFLLP